MARPQIKDKKEELKYLKYVAVIGYLVLFYIGQQTAKSGATVLTDYDMVTTRIKSHPFDIFPINGSAVIISTYIFLIICGLVYIEFLRRKRLRTKDEYGSAAWYTDFQEYYKTYAHTIQKNFINIKIPFEGSENIFLKFIHNLLSMIIEPLRSKKLIINDRPNNRNMIFSEKVVLDMNTRKTLRNNNILICGGSGSGKTRFNVKPNLLQANCSYVITDPSGEILKSCGKFLEKQGYKIKVFNLVQMHNSHSYNPFKYIRDEQGVLTMITTIVKNTSDKGASKGDPFWEKAESALLQAICFYLYYECREEDRNFSNVMKLIRCAEVKEDQEDYMSTLDIMFEELKKKNPEHIAVLQYNIFKQAAGKTAKSILITAATRLQHFNLQAVKKLTDVDTIDLKSIGDEKTALFCITPVVDTTYNFLVAMMYTQLFESLYYHAENECPGLKLPVHVRFMLDEFARKLNLLNLLRV